MRTLKQQLVRLAYERADIRPKLLKVLLKEAKPKSIHEKQYEDAKALSGVDAALAKVIVVSGDGKNDKIAVGKFSGAASSLKPSQKTMVLAKAVGMALGQLRDNKVGGDLDAILSSDKFIMDGHHRWAAAILAGGSSATVGGWQAKVKGETLVRVLNILTKGAFNIGRGKTGKGNLGDFTPGKVKKMLEGFIEEGISAGEYSWTPKQVEDVLKKNFGSVEEGVSEMAGNAGLVTKTMPSWAPNRVDMPVVDSPNIPRALKKLQKGEVDWAPKYKKG
jgi:hypothetical protein